MKALAGYSDYLKPSFIITIVLGVIQFYIGIFCDSVLLPSYNLNLHHMFEIPAFFFLVYWFFSSISELPNKVKVGWVLFGCFFYSILLRVLYINSWKQVLSHNFYLYTLFITSIIFGSVVGMWKKSRLEISE